MCNCNQKNHQRGKCEPKIVPSHFPCNCPSHQSQETQLKCAWEANSVGNEVDVFASPGQCRVVASGMINYECHNAEPTAIANVRFYNGASLVAQYTINEGGCLTFVAANFNRMTITSDHAGAQGEICINPIFKIPSH